MMIGWMSVLLQGPGMSQLRDLIAGMAFALFAIGGFLSMWFYGAIMETRYNGQTLGKMMTKIRSISSDGSAIDGTQATLRNFFRLMDASPIISLPMMFGPDAASFPVPLFSIGLICMVLSRRYQRLGDLVAGTIVVSEQRKWTHGLVTFTDARVSSLAELIPEDFEIRPSLAKTLAEYVDRRQLLHYERASEIASHLTKPLLKTLNLPSNTDPDLL